MITWALVAAFASGLAWAGLDIARKSLARELPPTVVATGLSLGLAALFGGWVFVAGPSMQPGLYVRPALVSISLCVAIQVLILESIRRAELSRTIPLLSLTPVATSLFGAMVLAERLTVTQWTGIGFVLAGAVCLGLWPRRRSGGFLPFRFDAGAGLMLAAALCISAAAPFDKLAVQASSPAVHGFLQSLVSGLLLLGFLIGRGELRQLGRSFRRRHATSLAVVLAFGALALQFTAYRGAMVGVVETIKRVVGLASSLAAGHLVFDEALTAGKLLGVALMAIGVALMLR